MHNAEGPHSGYQALPLCGSERAVLATAAGLPELPRLPAAAEEYLQAQVAAQPWHDHLSLAALACAGLGYSASHICTMLRVLHRRFLAIAAADSVVFATAVPTPELLAAYVCGSIVPEDPIAKRDMFVNTYRRAFARTRDWLAMLPAETRERLTAFLLPEVDPIHLRALLRGRSLSLLSAGGAHDHQAWHPPDGRAMSSVLGVARLRYAHLCAVYLAYREAADRLRGAGSTMPLELPSLTLHEPDRSMALRPRIWDRRSLCQAFPEQFSERQRQQLQRQPAQRSSGDELFLEVLPCEGDAHLPTGAWYIELLKRGVFGKRAEWGVGRQLAARQQWLRIWGYSLNGSGRAATPFATAVPGLLAWPNARSVSRFVEPLQHRLSGALVPVDTLVAAASFGLLALELYANLNLSGEALLGARKRRLRELGGPGRLLHSLHPHVEALHTESFDTETVQHLFCYGGHALESVDLAGCLRFLLHGIRYADGDQQRSIDGHGARWLIEAMLGLSVSRPRARPQPAA